MTFKRDVIKRMIKSSKLSISFLARRLVQIEADKNTTELSLEKETEELTLLKEMLYNLPEPDEEPENG